MKRVFLSFIPTFCILLDGKADALGDSVSHFQLSSHFKVEEIAREPLIESPVAFERGADGKLWVVEMLDYPQGNSIENHERDTNAVRSHLGKPNGRIVFLEDTNGDGVYNKATVFFDGLDYPTEYTHGAKGSL